MGLNQVNLFFKKKISIPYSKITNYGSIRLIYGKLINHTQLAIDLNNMQHIHISPNPLQPEKIT